MALRLKLIQSVSFALFLAPIFTQSSPLSQHRVFIPERGEVIGYLIAVNTNHYSFLPPPTWRVSCKPGANSVIIMAEDLRTSITIDFINNPEGEATMVAKESTSLVLERQSPTNCPSFPRAAELVSSRYPEGRIRETFVSLTGVGEAVGFDVERKARNASKLVSRVVYAAQEWGQVEFTLTAPAGKFAESTTTFANVINSFHRPAP